MVAYRLNLDGVVAIHWDLDNGVRSAPRLNLLELVYRYDGLLARDGTPVDDLGLWHGVALYNELLVCDTRIPRKLKGV